VDPITDRGLERDLYYLGEYESGTVKVLEACLRTGDTFIDVGANIGFISMVAANLIADGRLLAFEPHPQTFEMLKINLANLATSTNVQLFNLALGSYSGEGVLFDHLEISRGSASMLSPSDSEQPGIPVRVETLDNLIERERIDNVRMLKVDVEGYELDVLKGACKLLSSHRAPILCLEYSRSLSATQGDAYDYILDVNPGYYVFKLQKRKVLPSKLVLVQSKNALPLLDNLFCFLDSHLNELDSSILA
jgi:FkbM family methyltransferase